MLLKEIGSCLRWLPNIKGKGFFARRVLAPFMRGRGRTVVVPLSTIGGGKLMCNLDDWIPWNVYVYGNYRIEHKYEAVMLEFAKGATTIVDIGANIGYYTIQFGRLAGLNGVVHAFEPVAYQYSVLRQNVDINNLRNVFANKMIVTDKNGVRERIYFGGVRNTGLSSMQLKVGAYEDVLCVNMDRYCHERGVDRIDLMKIDVEGHELRVLMGASDLLTRGVVRHLFVEINNEALSLSGVSAREVLAYLAVRGYHPYSIRTGKMEKYAHGNDENLVYFTRNNHS